MDDELGKFDGTTVRIATVPEKKFGQEVELSDWEISC